MKTIIVLIFAISFGLHSAAQETRFCESFDEAKQLSDTEKIPLVIYFSGSDWCKPCIKLKKEILMSPEFAEYSKKLAIYIADFPFRTKQSKLLKKSNEALAEKYNKKGVFPYLIVLDVRDQVIYQVGYMNQSPTEFISAMKSGMAKSEK